MINLLIVKEIIKVAKLIKSIKHEWPDNKDTEFYKDKILDFERKTGVPWSCFHGHGKMVFLPFMHRELPEIKVEENSLELITIIKYWKQLKSELGYVSFLDISTASHMSLHQIMGIIKYLMKTGKAHVTVNRMGKGTYFKLKDIK